MTKENCSKRTRSVGLSRNKIIEYRMVEETLLSKELGVYYHTYGIAVFENGKQTELVSDVSLDRTTVKELVRKCNKYALEPIHLYDVIEDILA